MFRTNAAVAAVAATPWQVRAAGNKVVLFVMNEGDNLPATFALMGTTVSTKAVLRFTGGCKGMNAQDKANMVQYFQEACAGMQCLLFTGGTRQANAQNELDPMVTDVPGFIAGANPGCKVLSTVPRTDLMSLQGEHSRVHLDGYGAGLNPDHSGILIVQKDAENPLDWNGDLGKYFALMEMWLKHAGFHSAGVVAWNGGGVTKDEIMTSAKKGWPTILIKGTGRATDEIAAQLEAGDQALLSLLPQNHKLCIATSSDPLSLRALLIEHRFLIETA